MPEHTLLCDFDDYTGNLYGKANIQTYDLNTAIRQY